MKKYLLFFNIIMLITIIFAITIKKQTIPTIKYFPIDQEISFKEAETSLTLEKKDSPYMILWESKSATSEPVYLRQDVSLLYGNGKLIGLRSKWVESEQKILLQEYLEQKENRLFQAISFHHGESHYNEKEIKSIQQMSHEQLFVIEQNNSSFQSIKQNYSDKNSDANKLDKQIKQDLLVHWTKLIHHFQINIDEYNTVPLTNLNQAYLAGNLPLPEVHETQIIGQLWEGLYRNYVIPTMQTNKGSFIPLVLFAKDETHLIVLFNIDHQKEKLLQQYPGT